MRFGINILAVCFVLVGVNSQAEVDKCPKDEYACLDVINSSLCLSQNAARNDTSAMVKCVEYEGAASDLPGKTKVS